MTYERITNDPIFNEARQSHEYRYQIIGKLTEPTDKIVDMACGTGYGRMFLKGKYIGVDKEDLCQNIVADLNTWTPDFDYDVAISFETIEHLKDYTQLVKNLKKAKRLIALSTPIVPTKHRNEYHLQDFTVEQVEEMFKEFKLVYKEIQNNLYGVWIWSVS